MMRQMHVLRNHAKYKLQYKYCTKTFVPRGVYESHKVECRKIYKSALQCNLCSHDVPTLHRLKDHKKLCGQKIDI